ncbi:class F sortase [Crossiella equi]|uniref:class F sortase n=1 Tax=Crossiella equi TaxID=130796 RepID=UPI0020110497|nr:class F sortase [Crossiella equi]
MVSVLLLATGAVLLSGGARDLLGQVFAEASAPAGGTPSATAKPMRKSDPVSVEIPKIGAKSSLTKLGLNKDGTVQVPPVSQPMQAGWYSKGPTPGEKGPAVLLGHVDGAKKPGIFFKLKELVPGDEVLVKRADGSTAKFVVTKSERVPKTDFPTDDVYGQTDGPELRLITCGGSFDKSAGSYRDNTIVFASLVA